jgi:hypothetical protein
LTVEIFRETLRRASLPNALVGGALVVILAAALIIVFSLSAGKSVTESVQIAYQLGLLLAGVIGLPLAIWRSLIAHRQAATAEAQLKGLQQQISLAEAGANVDRLQKGAEMLQADGLAVRVAGIAILREIAHNKNHRYRNEAILVVSSFARFLSAECESRKSNSPEDLVNAFGALISTTIPPSIRMGKIILRSGVIHDFNVIGYEFAQCEFHDCHIYNSKFSADCGSDFYGCEFFHSKIDFDGIGLSRFDNCRFSDCRFDGHLDGPTLEGCAFSSIKRGKNFKLTRGMPELAEELS